VTVLKEGVNSVVRRDNDLKEMGLSESAITDIPY